MEKEPTATEIFADIADTQTLKSTERKEQEIAPQISQEVQKLNTEDHLHKFKTPNELFKAYAQLEGEFTKRSQKLKQLENELKMVKEQKQESSSSQNNASASLSATAVQKENCPQETKINEQTKQKIIEEYLKNTVQKTPIFITNASAVATQNAKPILKSFDDARAESYKILS